jgi:transcriptional regulator with XRE-family HTH domain
MPDVGLPGQQLRRVREQLGLTMRAVETASNELAGRHSNHEFAIPPSRLSDIETKGIVPSIYRLYSLALIYRLDLGEILCWYGVNLYEDVFAGKRTLVEPTPEVDNRP